ncbi:MAG TPA: hypothetical protein VH396_07160 [Chitinophagaceae bacterium]|jgi:hypothetical protein
MKKITLVFSTIFLALIVSAQTDFKSNVASARSAYTAGKLEDAHFSLQQAMGELDIIIGKEVLKTLPTQLEGLNSNSKDDNVTATAGFIGATIHRSYGDTTKGAEIEIISNSPLLGTLNAFLNMPILGGMMHDENTKILKVQGYKSRLERTDAGNGKYNYKLDIPFTNALLTLNADKSNEAEITNMANKIPLQDIAKLIQ